MGEAFTQRVESVLQPLLGPHTAQRAIRLAAAKIGREPSALRESDAEAVIAVIAPMLRTLAGRKHAEAAAEKIRGGSR